MRHRIPTPCPLRFKGATADNVFPAVDIDPSFNDMLGDDFHIVDCQELEKRG